MIRLRVLSLGAGVQSTTLALMAAAGEIGPMPDCAIFADTGDEPEHVYRHLTWVEQQLPFPVYRVKRPGLSLSGHVIASVETGYSRTASPPFFTKDPSGMLPRQCSSEFKVRPIISKVREMIGLQPRQRGPKRPVVEQWLGISLDEVIRMKPSRVTYIENRWPLIENRLSRSDCLLWMQRRGFPKPPKSACVFCPYHDQQQWRDLRDKAPNDWAKAVAFDAAVRAGPRGLRGTMYVHRQLVPLDEVDLRTAEDRGQGNLFGDQFNNECEGLCGV